MTARRSDQNSAERASAARIASCTSPSGRGAPPTAPSTPGVLPEVHGYAIEAGADPDELPRRAQLVELLGAVIGHAPGQQLRLPQRDGQRERLQRHERLTQARAAVDAVPGGEEARERRLLGRLHLLAQRRQRRSPQPAQHLRVAPLALGAAGAQLAAHEQLFRLECAQDVLDVPPEAGRRLRRRERPSPPRPPVDELAQRRLGIGRLEERVGQARRRHDAERVAIAPGVLGGDQPLLAGDVDANGAPRRRAAARPALHHIHQIANLPYAKE